MLGAAAVGALALGGTVTAAEPSVEQALPPAPVDCRQIEFDGSMYWRCDVTASGVVDVDALPGGVDGKPVVVDARGNKGATVRLPPGDRTGGDGGRARTAIDGSQLDDFFVYMQPGHPSDTSRAGGSATVMSKVPIEQVRTVDDVYAIAGGGGAQGQAMMKAPLPITCGGGSGGHGGIADAALEDIDAPGVTPHAVTGQGARGGSGNLSGHCGGNPGQRPFGGVDGVGGDQPGDSRKSGKDGIGGVGGGDSGWNDRNDDRVAVGYFGGEGGSSDPGWAKGGGGHGGGGGGERFTGGGGGGSCAAAPTASAGAFANEPLPPTNLSRLVLFYPAD